ncbi:STAS domain-containing protein [Azospirillum doebereinerae]|uniref:Anti-sigma factor antagonist n=1 Tax=Azospirillum doebereinerae TaxID=92933 RepID=A0A3S0WVS9_9PROT|nr:STAS domain-containing protein [Azospirillum doebereinerae]MCG5243002.1 STAS domain-containing protein [Azospirillum doebereinerae]RUQ65035.1 anti-sigma factor antagonist [Azospirillum doebereinerae]
MEYAFTDVDGQDGILLSGRCTYEDGPRFHAMLGDWNFAARPIVPLDLRFVTFIDSAAIGMLFILANRCREANGHIVAIGASPHVMKSLRRAALDPYIEFR